MKLIYRQKDGLRWYEKAMAGVQARRFICLVFLRVLENVSMVRGICIDIT